MDLPGGGNHWMRNLLLSPDGKKLYVAIGSSSNIGEHGMKAEEGRAMIEEIDVKISGKCPPLCDGHAQSQWLGWNPSTGELWSVVNERDQLGPIWCPITSAMCPWACIMAGPGITGDKQDERVDAPIPRIPQRLCAQARICAGAACGGAGGLWGGARLGDHFTNGAFIARHGSWNRRPAVGYDVVFVEFDANGNPQGLPKTVLTGF
jgi:glucose/arabinose dehydrogenase